MGPCQTVQAAGVPKVRNGSKIAAALSAALMKLSTTFLGAGDAASALPTDDPTTFLAQAEKLANAITSEANAVRKSLTAAGKKYASPQLDAAAKHERACKGILS